MNEQDLINKLNIFFKETDRFDLVKQVEKRGLPKVIYIFDNNHLERTNALFCDFVNVKVKDPKNGFNKDDFFMSWMDSEMNQELEFLGINEI